jgi:ATP-dependent Clp protease ATP-binding subunit ClpA
MPDKNLGFVEKSTRPDAGAGDAIKVLKRSFPPEFLNRIDEIVVFNRLGDEDLRKIVRLLIADLNVTLQQHQLVVTLTDDACDWLVKTTVKDRAYGARPLRRAIQKQVEDPLAELMVAQDTVPAGMVHFDLVDEKLVPLYTPSPDVVPESQLTGV